MTLPAASVWTTDPSSRVVRVVPSGRCSEVPPVTRVGASFSKLMELLGAGSVEAGPDAAGSVDGEAGAAPSGPEWRGSVNPPSAGGGAWRPASASSPGDAAPPEAPDPPPSPGTCPGVPSESPWPVRSDDPIPSPPPTPIPVLKESRASSAEVRDDPELSTPSTPAAPMPCPGPAPEPDPATTLPPRPRGSPE